ncbi:hypothetical protein [Nostoc sp. MG11]|uniref:hypothetical protein n=1 Tax=Nostoc sp. MG11 TaxID=2721166 RepID=UPI001866A506|nr:hypothetical protein [Nostoc sp. MG11]
MTNYQITKSDSDEVNLFVDLSIEEQQSICGGFFETNSSNISNSQSPDFTLFGILATSNGQIRPALVKGFRRD